MECNTPRSGSLRYDGTSLSLRLSKSIKLTHPGCNTALLIYMSIRAHWQRLVHDRELFRLSPLPGDPRVRTVLMTEEVREILTQEMPEGPDANRRSRLLARLQGIVAGRALRVCMTPYKARKAVIGRLEPIDDSVWDVRCQDPPAIRVFCRFVERDVLFAVTVRPRSRKLDWLAWLPLGDRNSKQWKKGIAETKRQWSMFFAGYDPVKGERLNEYLSNASLERDRGGP